MLYTEEAFKLIFDALTDDGIACIQAESLWLMFPLIQKWTKIARKIFPVVSYASIYVPSYPSGQIGFLLLSKNKDTVFTNPIHSIDSLELNYYSKEIHSSSFLLPSKFQKVFFIDVLYSLFLGILRKLINLYFSSLFLFLC